MTDLGGRTVVITGATSGIGRATAVALARMGPRLLLLGRNPERCDETLAEIARATGRSDVDLIRCDLSSLAGIRAAADREVTVLKANAYRDSELIRGEGDATATATYADAFNQDPEFYSFTRSLRAYQDAFQGNGDIMLLQPDSEFFRYLKDSSGGQ